MKKNNPYQGIAWFVGSLMVGCGNDILTKYISNTIAPWEITFFRCALGTFFLLPIMLGKGIDSFKTQRIGLHILRGFLLFCAMGFWSIGIQHSPLTIATIMSFTVPIFLLLLAPIFLKEKVRWPMWIVTMISFAGIVMAIQKPGTWSLNGYALFFVFAAILFAGLDIINKKFVDQEPLLCMLFYSSLAAAVFTFPPALYQWQWPTGSTFLLLLCLGLGGNLILYCLLKAFTLVQASFLAPFRYLEFLFSILASLLLFQETPSFNSYISACIIIPCAFYIILHKQKPLKSL